MAGGEPVSTIEFTSCLGSRMEKFCALRRLSGTDYLSQTRLLGYFDKFLVEQNFEGNSMTADLVDLYMRGISGLAPRSQSNRLCVIRQFCIYLCQFQPNSYVPEERRTPSSSSVFQPYLFTPEEVRLLISQARELGPLASIRGATLATLFGLLFAAGLRIAEALALNIEDFSPESMILEVRKGKFRKQRLVLITDSTCTALGDYIELRLKTFPLEDTSPLFVNIKGKRLSQASARVPFVSLLHQTGIYSGSGQRPRLHDLRHAFAVQRLLLWYQDGSDFRVKLPSLATYMGHVNIRSTQTYIHTTPQLREEASQLLLSYYQTHILGSGR